MYCPAGVPYDLTPEFLHELFTKHKIDYVLHGDDPCLLPDGTDAYEHAKRLGRFKMVSREDGACHLLVWRQLCRRRRYSRCHSPPVPNVSPLALYNLPTNTSLLVPTAPHYLCGRSSAQRV